MVTDKLNGKDGYYLTYSDEMKCIRLGVSGELRPVSAVRKKTSLRDKLGWSEQNSIDHDSSDSTNSE